MCTLQHIVMNRDHCMSAGSTKRWELASFISGSKRQMSVFLSPGPPLRARVAGAAQLPVLQPGAMGTIQVEAAAQVLPQLCPLPTKIWLFIPCPAGEIVGLSFGSSPGDLARVPGDSGTRQSDIP